MNNEIPVQTAALTPEPGDAEADVHAEHDSTQVLPAAADPAAGDDDVDIDLESGDLSSDPFTDDLSAELATAAGKRWRNRATTVLAALAILAIGFLGGTLVQKNFGSNTRSSGTSGRNGFSGSGLAGGNFPGFQRGSGSGSGSGSAGAGSVGAGSSQTGTIILVDGTTIYVKLANGDTVTVKTTGSTKVSLASTTKVSSLKKGQQVTFAGSTDSSTGTVTATSVTASK